MKKNHRYLLFVVFAVAISGCSINHPIAKDYPQYLTKHGDEGSLPKTDLQSRYEIEGNTQHHRYEFRAASVGYAHVWIVEFGKILDETLNAPYVQSSFGKLEKSDLASSGPDNNIEFILEKYEFKNYRAFVTMNIIFSSGGNEIINKTYTSEGLSKGGQMWGAGPFGMKTATLDSTRSAIDDILAQFIRDIPKA